MNVFMSIVWKAKKLKVPGKLFVYQQSIQISIIFLFSTLFSYGSLFLIFKFSFSSKCFFFFFKIIYALHTLTSIAVAISFPFENKAKIKN